MADALLGNSAKLAEIGTPEELRGAAENAERAGDTEAAGRLRAAARRIEANRELVLSLRRSAEKGHATAQALLGRIRLQQDDAEAESWIRRAVAQDDAWGSFYLGLMYYRGQGVTEDTAEAMRLWRKAADQDLSQGAAEIGNVYFLGIDVDEDEDVAARWYRRAAELDSVDTHLGGTHEAVTACGAGEGAVPSLSMEQLRRRLEQNDETEIADLRKAAEQGDADAQFLLAASIGDDSPDATRWLRRAAEQGHAFAQHFLGVAYDAGEGGVAEDDAEAVRWFQCAERQWRVLAARSDPDAQYSLGSMYEQGAGVLKNHLEAERWYRLAAEQGHVLAQFSLGAMYELGRPREGIEENEPEAARWYRIAAESGHAYSQEILGRMYDTEEDQVEVARLWRAAKQGRVRAQYELGHKYDSADGVGHNDPKAAKWYRRAADQGHASAQYELGMMYRYEYGHLGQDLDEAARWFRLAAEQGHAKAQYSLGLMYGCRPGSRWRADQPWLFHLVQRER